MTKFLLALVFSLAPVYLKAQIIVEGSVKDQSNNPIPYASIGIKNSRSGSLATENGQYKLVVPDHLKDSAVIFSALGYLAKVVGLNELKNNGNVVLTEKVAMLNEISINGSKLNEKTIGQQSRPFLTFSRMFDQNVPTIEQGNIFELFPETRLNSYNFYIMPSSRFKQISLKLNIYKLKNDLPQESVLQENLLYKTTTTGWQHIDLSSYALSFKDLDKIAVTLQLVAHQPLTDTAFVFGLSAKKSVSRNLLFRYQSQGNWEASQGSFISNLQVSYNPKGKKSVDEIQVQTDTSSDLNTKMLTTVYLNRARAQKSRYGKNKSGKYIDVTEGKIYYETYGKGEPLVLLHGNAGSIADFYQQIPQLSKYFQVIAIDTRSQGRSTDLSAKPFSYQQFASDLFKVIETLQLKKVNILGWSDGGNTGLAFTLAKPELVNKLIMIGANLSPSGVKDEVLTMFQKRLSENVAGTDMRLLKLMLEQPEFSKAQLGQINNQAMVIAGAEDVIKEEHTRSIARWIKNSQLKLIPNATHYLPFERPEELNSLVLEFLKNERSNP
ncbi:oxidoreductase [Pedobacter sp. KBW06]|uniref:alpha/beta fold hydrolase n=1 Tax=Pedobacter sp. KBW06 TaxID=2153359 RepID=UPI000F5B37CD|nr:alpha/beta fold hydrolase [Pedobacter sp. KBW06]RQO65940.1 oxidoreductase [Pedobacter sp. KBW06]